MINLSKYNTEKVQDRYLKMGTVTVFFTVYNSVIYDFILVFL